MKFSFTLIMIAACFFATSTLYAQCGSFSAPAGVAGSMTTVDLSTFDAVPGERFVLELTVRGGDGGNSPMGLISSSGTEGTEITASFEIPATGNLVYITGESGFSSSDGMFAGGGGGSAIWYDPDGVSNNGDEVLLIAGAGGGGAHEIANAANPTTTSLAEAEAATAPTASSQAAAGETPTSVGGGGGGGFGFDGGDAIATVIEGGIGASFGGVSAGGVGALGANGGSGFGGGGGGGQVAVNGGMTTDVNDFHAGGGGGGYVGGDGGAYDDARVQPGISPEERVFRAEGGGSFLNAAPTAGVVRTGGATFSSGGSGAEMDGLVSVSCSSVVPVELISFSGEVVSNEVLLEWVTASELDNAGFNIERSEDGSNWETIAFVKGAGTTIETQYYKHKDENPSKLNYYRLEQIDIDGSKDYSQIIVVLLQLKESDLYLFPNPIVDIVEYQLSNANLEDTHTVMIYDWSGRMVRQYQQAANSVRTIDMSDLNSGTYNIIIASDTWRHAKAIVKQ